MPAVFTPENEPYLGRETVQAFDNVIITCLATNEVIAPHTHEIELSELQRAACELIPPTINLSLSIRELVRQGYIYGAMVLIRPLTERAVTLLYLYKNPEKLALWHEGWPYSKRPKLSQIIESISDERYKGFGPTITTTMNSLTHGDPASAHWNLVDIGNEQVGHGVGKMLNNPDLCDSVCVQASAWMTVTMALMPAIFPDAKPTNQAH